jgi:hypothetical protein
MFWLTAITAFFKLADLGDDFLSLGSAWRSPETMST